MSKTDWPSFVAGFLMGGGNVFVWVTLIWRKRYQEQHNRWATFCREQDDRWLRFIWDLAKKIKGRT